MPRLAGVTPVAPLFQTIIAGQPHRQGSGGVPWRRGGGVYAAANRCHEDPLAVGPLWALQGCVAHSWWLSRSYQLALSLPPATSQSGSICLAPCPHLLPVLLCEGTPGLPFFAWLS